MTAPSTGLATRRSRARRSLAIAPRGRASPCRPSRRSSTAGRTSSPETRRRVEAAIREHGYQPVRPDPSRAAPLHRAHLPRAGERVGAGDRAGRRAGRRAAPPGRRPLGDAGPPDARPRLDRGGAGPPSDRRHRGLLRPQRDRCGPSSQTRGIPFVVVDPTGEPLHDTPSIGATNWNGGLTATRHLLGLGHRRIGVIGGPDGILCSRARLDGYRAAMDAAGVPVDPDLISHGAVPCRGGHRAGPGAAAPPGPPDGDLRRQRPAGARRLPGRPGGTAPHPRGPERRRLRRPAGRALGRSAADDGPPATGRDGRGGRPSWSSPWPAASSRHRPGWSSRRSW